ncbi:MAG: RagB/SusD family nutrient uptake outer membrane protein [Bacteroidetes bacterium]|nr:RagB/SusD family nutrient uptake outer membrane protein [Bacteroidota bacterium]
MKKIITILLGFLVIASISSCSKLLEVKPDNLVGVDEGLKTAADLQAYLNGAYDVFRNTHVMGGTAFCASDVLAQETDAASTGFEWGQIKTLNMNLFNPIGRDIWKNSYLTIQRVNVVIDYLDKDKITVSADQKKVWKAEAQFIRAVCYFHLLQFFSLPYDPSASNTQPGVPLRTEAVLTNEFAATQVPRSSAEEVYQFILTELQAAEANLPVTPALPGHVSMDGATAFLAKVYLQMGNMAKAFQYADKVVSTGRYSLDNYWLAKFASASLDSTTHEVIFGLASSATSDNSGSGYIDSYRTNKLDPPGFGPSSNLATILKTINTDIRATQLVNKAGQNNTSGLYSTKYNYEYMVAPVICYNEILLIRAEAGLATTQGTPDADLNAIQIRAGVPQTAATADNILLERRKELALEGKYFFDLKRLQSSNIHGGVGWNSPKLIFQIPDLEQNGNPNIVLN